MLSFLKGHAVRPGLSMNEVARTSAEAQKQTQRDMFEKIISELPMRIELAAMKGENRLIVMEIHPINAFRRRWYQAFLLKRTPRNLKEGLASIIFQYCEYHGMKPEIHCWEWGTASEACAIFVNW